MFDRVKQSATGALKQAADVTQKAAAEGASKAGIAVKAQAKQTADQVAVTLKDPATKEKAKGAVKSAGRGVKSALDRVNPSMLAGIVMKATSLQEQANVHLQRSGSLYRIGGIEIGAAFPPSVTFQVVRLADLDPIVEAQLLLRAAAEAKPDAKGEG